MKKLLALGLLLAGLASVHIKAVRESCPTGKIANIEKYIERYTAGQPFSKKSAYLSELHRNALSSALQYATLADNPAPDTAHLSYEERQSIQKNHRMFADMAKQELNCIEQVAQKHNIPLAMFK